MPTASDQEKYQEYYSRYEKLDRAELIAAYNSTWETGLTGNHMQAVNCYAMRKVFLKVFNKSPITLKDNVVLALTEKIYEQGETWEYEATLAKGRFDRWGDFRD